MHFHSYAKSDSHLSQAAKILYVLRTLIVISHHELRSILTNQMLASLSWHSIDARLLTNQVTLSHIRVLFHMYQHRPLNVVRETRVSRHSEGSGRSFGAGWPH